MKYQGPIIDAHMHLWDPNNGYEWLSNTDPFFGGGKLNRPFLVPDYLEMIQDQNITAAVHVQCGGFPEDPVLESQWLQEQADQTGWPQAIVAFAKLDDADIEHQLERHLQYKNVTGIRMLLSYAENEIKLADRGDYLQDAAWLKGYDLLAKHNLSFDMQIWDVQLEQAYQMAKAHPETRLVLSHLASPTKFTPEGFEFWKKGIEKMAALPHVMMKISCIGCIFMKNDPAEIIPYIQAAIDAFGVDRCLFGSNCPPDAIHIPFDDIYKIFFMATEGCSEEEHRKMFYENAKEVYRVCPLLPNSQPPT